jgi:hypothetical protein
MNKKVYRIEMESTTYHIWQVEADSVEKAQQIAYAQMDKDEELSHDWKIGAEIVSCNPLDGTSHMNDEEFGEYIKNS